MSMDRCKTCEEIIDTDFDCEFYDFSYLANDMGGHCQSCRDNLYEQMSEAQQADHEKRLYG